ncbi:MAG: hypothetical protein RL556_186 [Actinomycetota bacterium]
MNANEKPTLLLIDGHSLAFRAFYALSPDSFRAPSGQHTNAVHGFISMMLNILQVHKPTHLAVAFDLSRSSFRTDEYPEYKGTRGETPPEFNGQTEVLTKALAAMQIKTLTRENYEADDIIASLADQGAEAGYRVLVVSGDRDTFQLISENTTILYPVKGVLNLANMDDQAVFDKYGVHAKQYPDLAALVGETSDNLPGIPGVGPKTAAKWLQQYHTLEGVFAASVEIPGKVGESLREHMQLAVRNRRLNHLLRDLSFDFEFDSLKLVGVNQAEVREYFSSLAFKSLTEKVLRSKELGNSSEAIAIAQAASQSSKESSASTAPAAIEPRELRDFKLPESSKLDAIGLTRWLKANSSTLGFAVEFAVEVDGIHPVHAGFSSETERVHWFPSNTADFVAVLGVWLSDEQVRKAV